MKKIFTFIFLVGFINQAQAYDCSFDKLMPGASKKSLEEINIFAYGQEEDGIFIKQLSPFDICQNDLSKVHGLRITLFFSEDNLIKINYENDLPNSNILFDIANNDYKLNLERDEKKIINKQPEFYSTSKNNNSYFYVILKANNHQREYLEIIDDLKIEKFESHILKLEETKP